MARLRSSRRVDRRNLGRYSRRWLDLFRPLVRGRWRRKRAV